MKIIVSSMLLFSCTLLAMEKGIEHKLQKLGIKISRINIDSSELGHIRFHHTPKGMLYLATCSDGEIMATCCSKSNTISCKKRIFCLSDGAEGVYQQYSERDIDSAYYHLLRILHKTQERRVAEFRAVQRLENR